MDKVIKEMAREDIMDDLKRARSGLKKAKLQTADNEIQELEIKSDIKHYEYRIDYLKKMLKENK
jgi:hypothetical protein